jgi:hypothetical protein
VADGWCWFLLREEYCWLVAGGWFVLREKYCWLVADKPSEQEKAENGAREMVGHDDGRRGVAGELSGGTPPPFVWRALDPAPKRTRDGARFQCEQEQ